ncbi:aldo/keto reductase [Halomicrobium urmianum]|uniref:aldo/keto reductase n=1 Tax=Halomicrobium urmianum TaxID=1586233 RepID=UPI001CD9446E|nr:aldo/keto reductase [Halomicrobium urmianum]
MDLPQVGLGTMGIEEPETITTALEMGYRHLDTAQIYGNEAVVGEGLAASDVDREDVTVATKLWIDSLAAEDVREGTEASLDRLGLDYVDLLYVHRPRGDYEPGETLPALDAVREDGLAREIGVSNFTPDQLATAREHLDEPIAANQVEFHPYYREPGALDEAREHGYPLVAYSPLIGGDVFDDTALGEIAEKHGVSPAAVSVAWLCGIDGVVTIPKASSEEHLRANLAAAALDLDDEDVARIEGIDREKELYPE